MQYALPCHICLFWYPSVRSAPLISAVRFHSWGWCSFEETVPWCNLGVCCLLCTEHHEGHRWAWQPNSKEEVANKAEGKEMTPGHCLKTGSVRPLTASAFLSLLLLGSCFSWLRGTFARRPTDPYSYTGSHTTRAVKILVKIYKQIQCSLWACSNRRPELQKHPGLSATLLLGVQFSWEWLHELIHGKLLLPKNIWNKP